MSTLEITSMIATSINKITSSGFDIEENKNTLVMYVASNTMYFFDRKSDAHGYSAREWAMMNYLMPIRSTDALNNRDDFEMYGNMAIILPDRTDYSLFSSVSLSTRSIFLDDATKSMLSTSSLHINRPYLYERIVNL